METVDDLRKICNQKDKNVRILRKQLQRAKEIISRTVFNTKEGNKEVPRSPTDAKLSIICHQAPLTIIIYTAEDVHV